MVLPQSSPEPEFVKGLISVLKSHDLTGDGTISCALFAQALRVLDTSGFWTDDCLQSLYKFTGCLRSDGTEDCLDIATFANGLRAGSGNAHLVDYAMLRKDLRNLMEAPEWDDGSYGPLLMRLAWHSSGTYCAADGTGGSNGATMRHAKEANDPENAGLAGARALLEPIKERYPSISVADLWILAAVVAIEHTGGPRIGFTGGRVDAPEGLAIHPGRLPGAEAGLPKDSMEIDAEGRIAGWEANAQHVRDVFCRMGLTDREAVALLCVGHNYGRCHPEHSGYNGAWVENSTLFSTEYAADMIDDEWMLVGHDTLMPDGKPVPEEVRPSRGKRQYINMTKVNQYAEVTDAAITAPDATKFQAGSYRCVTEWVNCRALADTASPIIGRFLKDQEITIVFVRVVAADIRGCTDRGCWVSLVASGGEQFFERIGDFVEQDLVGSYRVIGQSGLPTFQTPEGAEQQQVSLQTEFAVEEIMFGSDGGSSGAVFGRRNVGDWALLFSPSRDLPLAERIVKGWNETPRRPLRGQTGHQMMLVSDMVLLWDSEFRKHLQVYAESEDSLRNDFAEAFQRLTELGCPWSDDRGPVEGSKSCASAEASTSAGLSGGCPFLATAVAS